MLATCYKSAGVISHGPISPSCKLLRVAAWASSQMATGFQEEVFQEMKAEAGILLRSSLRSNTASLSFNSTRQRGSWKQPRFKDWGNKSYLFSSGKVRLQESRQDGRSHCSHYWKQNLRHCLCVLPAEFPPFRNALPRWSSHDDPPLTSSSMSPQSLNVVIFTSDISYKSISMCPSIYLLPIPSLTT